MRPARAAAVLALLACLASPARAFFVTPIVKETLGSGQYVSNYGAVDFGGTLHFKPSFNSYHSDQTTGTYETWGLKATYDTDLYSVALTGGFSPRVDGYANHFVGGELSRTFDFAKAAGHARTISKVELTGAVTQTGHSDQFSGTLDKNGRLVLTRSTTSTLDIGQTDVEGIIGVDLAAARLELDVTKSVYNKDIARVGARAAQVAFLSGLSGTIQGFPDLNVSVRADWQSFEAVTPWVSYTYTEYKVQQRPSAAYALGVDAAAVEPFLLSLNYQRLAQSGQADRDFYTAQASYRFP